MVTITISGTPGSGKSTVAQLLHEKLNIPYVYSGKIFRSMAQEYEMNLAEFGAYCENHSEIDRELDARQVDILGEGNVILEGRLAGWLAYQNNVSAVKIMLIADVKTRAKRVVEREKGGVEERMEEVLRREKSETKRYKQYYDIDILDTSIYDLVIDSSKKTPSQIVEIILKFMNEKI
jgi:predicted cytidylate kinase